GPLLAVEIDHIALNAIGALPHHHAALVVELLVAIGGIHFAGLGVERLIARQHLGVFLLVLLREATGVDVALGCEIAGDLIHADAVGGGHAGGVGHARAGVEDDEVV